MTNNEKGVGAGESYSILNLKMGWQSPQPPPSPSERHAERLERILRGWAGDDPEEVAALRAGASALRENAALRNHALILWNALETVLFLVDNAESKGNPEPVATLRGIRPHANNGLIAARRALADKEDG